MEMEMKIDVPNIPHLVYMEFDTDDGKSFVIFENGELQKNINGIALVHNKDEYALDLDREIGFNE